MRRFRTCRAFCLILIFCSYYAGISMFSHTHISGGTSVAHSHLGGGTNHEHTDSQYAVIDILSNFQSEISLDFYDLDIPFFRLSESFTVYDAPSLLNEAHAVNALRGPPRS